MPPTIHQSPEKLVQGVLQLVSLPTIYFRLRDVVNHPQSSAKDIANLLSEDPGLTARLLRIANSAYFGFPSKIDTVTRAVTIIGSQQLCDLVLATSVTKVFKNMPQDLVTMETFWRHSIGVALFARAIAVYRRENNAESYFVAGLLHDIGRLILYAQCQEPSKAALECAQQTGELLYVVERKSWGFDHADVGKALLAGWNLPTVLQEVVGCHHVPHHARQEPVKTAVLHVADVFANALNLGSSGEHLVPKLNSQAWEQSSLTPQSIASLAEEVLSVFEETTQLIIG